ncbi:MAG: C39 family peptidase [Candidatus Faecousia sp.]|nr:C39 family peptidase [Candidatus Faecousia sp.]
MSRFALTRRALCLALAVLMLTGCSGVLPAAKDSAATTAASEASAPTETEPAPTAPPDGNPDDVTCKGSYTGTVNASAVVASVGEETLTGGLLQALYDLEAATWKQSGSQPSPDWEQGLDTQTCPLDTDAVTWQQYFLGRALASWHSYVVLVKDSETAQMPIDPEYKPYDGNYEKYMTDTMPAIAYLYGRDPSYKVNSLHQAFIDALPDTLPGASKELLAAAELANYAYGYFTFRHFFTELTDEELQQRAEDYAQEPGYTVSFRHILVADEETAASLLEEFAAGRKVDEPRFAVLANANSLDEGTRLDGGLYDHIAPGQVAPELDAWLFDESRTPGDTAVVHTGLGWHAVYFSGREDNAVTAARQSLWLEKDGALIRSLREATPMEVDYAAITLAQPNTDIGYAQALYPDIAHEQLPDVPLYIQQDYTESMYGAFPLISWGCGITTLAMFASYMADEYLTPPALAARYGSYCHRSGTDAMLISDAAPELGYFVKDMFFDWHDAQESMEEGYMVICLQHKGFFTRGGHYLVLRSINEDGTVSIRDSNLYNYGKLMPHKTDSFTWAQISGSGVQYWVFQNKITRIPACSRCGETAAPQGLLLADYTCPRCVSALTRRGDFLELCPEF